MAFQAEVGTREKAVEQSHETHEWGKEGVTRGGRSFTDCTSHQCKHEATAKKSTHDRSQCITA